MLSHLVLFSSLILQAPTASSFGLPAPDEMASKALSVAEQNLPQITMVGLSVYVVRKMLNEM